MRTKLGWMFTGIMGTNIHGLMVQMNRYTFEWRLDECIYKTNRMDFERGETVAGEGEYTYVSRICGEERMK